MIRRESAHELPRVPFDDRHLALDIAQHIERDERGCRYRFKRHFGVSPSAFYA